MCIPSCISKRFDADAVSFNRQTNSLRLCIFRLFWNVFGPIGSCYFKCHLIDELQAYLQAKITSQPICATCSVTFAANFYTSKCLSTLNLQSCESWYTENLIYYSNRKHIYCHQSCSRPATHHRDGSAQLVCSGDCECQWARASSCYGLRSWWMCCAVAIED